MSTRKNLSIGALVLAGISVLAAAPEKYPAVRGIKHHCRYTASCITAAFRGEEMPTSMDTHHNHLQTLLEPHRELIAVLRKKGWLLYIRPALSGDSKLESVEIKVMNATVENTKGIVDAVSSDAPKMEDLVFPKPDYQSLAEALEKIKPALQTGMGVPVNIESDPVPLVIASGSNINAKTLAVLGNHREQLASLLAQGWKINVHTEHQDGKLITSVKMYEAIDDEERWQMIERDLQEIGTVILQ